MAFRLSSAPALACFLLSFLPAHGQARSVSAWVDGLHSRVRLISGGRQGAQWISGIEIALDPGYKTYWRTPGDSGLPPRFDWSGSGNVSSVDLKWPPPSRQEEAGSTTYGYHDDVVLPVLVTPKNPAEPVSLALSVDYGVCKDICIPAHAEVALPLDRDGTQRPVLEKALAGLPRPQALGAPGPLSVVSIDRPASGKPGFLVEVRAPEGSRPALFAEGPDDWYLSTSLPDPENRFTVTVEEKPKDAAGPVPLRLTLVAGQDAVETTVNVDGGGPQ